jgi:hypothetical protein
MYSLNSSTESYFQSLKIQLPPSYCNTGFNIIPSKRISPSLCVLCTSPKCDTCSVLIRSTTTAGPVCAIPLMLIAVVMLGEESKLLSYPLCRFIFIHLLTINLIFKCKYSPVCSQTPGLHSSRNARGSLFNCI